MRSRFLILQLVLACFVMLGLAGTASAQCLTGWNWQMDVTISNGGATATDYFALITVNTATPITDGKMRSDGGDIRITDDDCNALDFWVESGLNTSSTKIWVVIPSLPNGSTVVSMYYGNATATRTNQASDVFGTGIAALYTFTEGSGSTLHDWVGGKDLTITSLTWGTGFRSDLGSLSGFGSGRAYRSDNGPALGSGDFSAVVFAEANNPYGSTMGLVGNYNNDGVSGWTLKLQGAIGGFMLLTNQNTNWCQQDGYTVPEDVWGMISGVRISGTGQRLYVGGSHVLSSCAGDNRNVNNSGPFEIGRSYGGNYPFDGSMSLVAIYTTALDDDGIADLHASLYPSTAPSVTNGSEEPNVQLTVPADVTIECDESTLPENTGTATVNVEGLTITYSDVVTAGACDNSYTITRTWSVTTETNFTITGDQTITVQDTEAPSITLSGTAIELSPPNHTYHTIEVSDIVASVSDNCASLDVGDVVITMVTSDEAENGDDDGNTVDDIVIAEDCGSVDLRAERSGIENGRVYRIHLALTDACGNETTASVAVSVRRGRSAAVEGSAVYSETSACGEVAARPALQTSGSQSGFYLGENQPNPVSGATMIHYGLSVDGPVRLNIIDANGRICASLVDERQESGPYSVQFHTGDLPSGTYYYVLEADGQRLVRTMTVVK